MKHIEILNVELTHSSGTQLFKQVKALLDKLTKSEFLSMIEKNGRIKIVKELK